MKNFLDIDDKIEANQKALEFYHINYQKIQSKISFLVILYSLISIYIIQILKFPFDKFKEIDSITFIVYIILLLSFLYFFIESIYNTFQIIKPAEVFYANSPNYFYDDIKNQYKDLLKTDDEVILNAYIKQSYLKELEITLEKNIALYDNKGRYFYNTFVKLLPALIFYVLCSGIVIFNNDNKNEIYIKNYQEIIKFSDSINTIKKTLKMADEKPKQTPAKETVKVDPSKVIQTQPRAVKESFNQQIKTDITSKTKKL
jgi:hypothetical protein